MLKRLLIISLIVLSVSACATTKAAQDPLFSLKRVTIIERSDGMTEKVEKEFERVTKEEFNLLTEAEKVAWAILKKQLGL